MKFVVAVKVDCRGQGIEATSAGKVPGVKILGASNPDRVLVDASAKAVAEVRRRLGNSVRIEPVIEHYTL